MYELDFKKIVLSLLAVPILLVASCGIEIVDAGHTGVEKKLGKISEETYDAGFYMVNPFTTSIIEMDNRIQRMESNTTTYTKDVQQATIGYVVNFNLEPSASAKILMEVGKDYDNKLIPQAVTGGMKNVIGQWNAIDLIANREKATQQIFEAISGELSKNGITVRNVELTDISYQDQFEKAVEDKVTAVQRAEESKNNTVRVQEEANQRIIAAKADAEAMQIKTQALKQSQSLVLYEAVQKWNGVLPVIMTGEGGTLLNVPSDVLGK